MARKYWPLERGHIVTSGFGARWGATHWGSVHVSPRDSSYDILDGVEGDPVMAGKFRLRHSSGCRDLTDLSNVVGGQLRRATTSLSSFLHLVVDVLEVRTNRQMPWVHAWRCVARVHHNHPARDGADENLIRHAVRGVSSVLVHEPPVVSPVLACGASPYPAVDQRRISRHVVAEVIHRGAESGLLRSDRISVRKPSFVVLPAPTAGEVGRLASIDGAGFHDRSLPLGYVK